MFRSPFSKIVVVVFIVIIIYFGVSFYVASRLVASNPTRLDATAKVVSEDFENISLQGTDNVTLKGWLFKASSDKLVILVAGAKENRLNLSYYAVLVARELIANNYNVIMYDSRGTGESGGKNLTFGLKESQDITKVVDFAKTKGFKPEKIAVLGDSLGAISVLLDASDLHDIGAIIADSGAATLKPSIEKILQKENGVPAIFNPGIYFMLNLVYGVDIDKLTPIKNVEAVPNRVFLFLHGAKDTTIPLKNSQELLSKANSKSKLVVFPEGEHVETYKTDPKKYLDTVLPFLEEQLGN